MNIFYLHADPALCAQQHVNKHVVKMVLEYAQLLSTAHRLLDGVEVFSVINASGRSIRRWQLPDERDRLLYSATHSQHPSALWTRASRDNYEWLYRLFIAVCAEYTFRYGKVHATAKLITPLQVPPNHSQSHGFTEPTPAMPDEYKVAGNVVQSYRNYYQGSKSHLFAWKNRTAPDWIV